MINTKLFLLVLVLCCAVPELVPGQEEVPFSFTLTNSASTSAGVFKRDGTLIKTLWSGIKYNAGSHSQLWDGTDDEGRLAPGGNYDIRVLSNNIKYTWEGVLGNTSDSLTGSSVHHFTQGFMYGMAISGTKAFFCTEYDEGFPAQSMFNTANPQVKFYVRPVEGGGKGQSTVQVATDDTNVYWAGIDPYSVIRSSFVFATKVSDDTEVSFSNGAPLSTTIGPKYSSAINVVNNNSSVSTSFITGMAVQKSGNYLFVSRKLSNTVYVLDKTTGALVQTLAVTAPRALAVDGNDNLWMISGTTTVAKYTVNANGTFAAPSITLAGLVRPLALAVSPNNATVVVADGGTSQQIKAFDNADGSLDWIYGQAGGYANNPAVADDKFFFNDLKILYSTDAELTFIAFQPDGSFWVGDTGNCRMQHFSSSRVYIDRIMNMGYFYSCFVDQNNPTRVFANYLEFSVDYTKPLAANNGSWTLVNNWGYGIPPVYDDQFSRLRHVVTLGNGRTYALLRRSNRYALIELASTGTRITNTEIDHNQKIYADGSLRSIINSNLGIATEWKKQTLKEFDGSNNPVWNPPVTIASTPPLTVMDPVTMDGRQNPGEVTNTDIVVSFCADKEYQGRHKGFHLGGVKLGTNKWLWRTSMATPVNYKGPFPGDGGFDIGNNVQYAGSFHQAIDRNIFWGYNGEAWKGTQVNKYNHYYDNGLFLGQFGADGTESPLEAAPEMAGNARNGTFIKDNNGDIYLYHCDESYHGGVHRWKISGINTIKEETATVILNVKTPEISVYPNPIQSISLVQHPLLSGKGSIELFSADGKRIKNWTIATGSSSTFIDTEFLPSGFYLLRYKSGSSKIITPVIKH